MARGRPANPDSAYTMCIHKNGKYRYASTQRAYLENGTKKFRHYHWGKLDDKNVFHPNHLFVYLSKEEKEKFIFPDDWDLSELTLLATPSTAPVTQAVLNVPPNMIQVAQSRSYGAVWLMERIGEQLNVREDLMITFHYDQAIVDDIMTVGMFLFIENINLDRLEDWQELEKYPSKRVLTPSAITELQKSITEQNRIDFVKCRVDRIKDSAVLAVDSTTKTGFGVKLIDLTWGKNKEGLNLPVTLEVVVYSITDHVPVYYRTFAGNTHDARTIDVILTDLKEAGFKNFILMMDRAYPSLKNIDRFIVEDVSIIACMRAGIGFALSRIKQLGTFSFVPNGFVLDEDLDLYIAQFDLERTVTMSDGSKKQSDRLKLNLYFDPVRRSRVLKDLDKSRSEERAALDELIANKVLYTLDEVEAIGEEYYLFNLKWKDHKVPVEACPEHTEDKHKRGRKKKFITKYLLVGYERNDEALMNEKIAAGFRALVTLGVDFSAKEAMDHYSLRGEQEMDNEQWKTQFPCDRERNSSEQAKAGASFIQFVGRIMSCSLRYKWRSTVELRKLFRSTLSILDEMKQIRCLEYPEQSKMLLTPFIGKQLDVCKYLNIKVPDGCAP